MDFLIRSASPLVGETSVAPDKSISHRAVMLSGIAKGHSNLTNVLLGEDNQATLNIMRLLGVQMHQQGDSIDVVGVGLKGLRAPDQFLDCGNSGTAMRLLAGLLAAQPFKSTLIGDESLSKRPMKRVIDPLLLMGGAVSSQSHGTPPLVIEGNPHLKAIRYECPMVSAQVKSCVLLAGLYADGKTTVIEKGISRDHTERMLRAFGVEVEQQNNEVTLAGGQPLTGCKLTIPGDISSAAFFIVAATIIPSSEVTLRSVGVNPTRVGIIDILRLMGANITLQNVREYGDEPVADIHVVASKLHGIEIPIEQVPLAIDEIPIIMIAAAVAKGVTRLRGAQELRVKESDRIATVAAGLTALGIEVETFEDGLEVRGGRFQPGVVDSHGDHRIAMAFSIAGSLINDVSVRNTACVGTSFPDFVQIANTLGCDIKEKL